LKRFIVPAPQGMAVCWVMFLLPEALGFRIAGLNKAA
jgi:hypothetical protein